MGTVGEAVHDGDPDLRGRGWEDQIYRPRASLDGRRPRGAREDGLPRRLGPVHRPACGPGRQDVTAEDRGRAFLPTSIHSQAGAVAAEVLPRPLLSASGAVVAGATGARC